MNTTAPKPDPAAPEATTPPDPVAFSRAMAEALLRLSAHSQKQFKAFLDKPAPETLPPVAQSLLAISQQMASEASQNPEKLLQAGMNLWQDYLHLWENTQKRFVEAETLPPLVQPAAGDKRFNAAAWQENALFDCIKQSYLLTSNWVQARVAAAESLNPHDKKKAAFYTRQFVDALSPSNFALTNPEVLRKTLDTGGENLLKGMENILKDLEKGDGSLNITMSDARAFEIGRNLANTPGKVIFQNDLMQLIHYEPLTPTTHQTPLLIIPPWINKFYILDLGEKKSFVRYLLQHGHAVFMISWINPDKSLAAKDFADYMVEGPMAAMAEIRAATGENSVNLVGYCIGGTLLGTLLAYLEARPQEKQLLPHIRSATFLVTLLDFSEPGDLAVFMDAPQLAALETQMQQQGFLEGSSMASTFNLLRANDLIWSFVVNNYLLGNEPMPFDLLYWNADSTRMPAAMHAFYLREMYQKNSLAQAGGLKLKGQKLNLGQVHTPAFFLSTRDDHIAPWQATYAGSQLFSGPITFMLAASGHIAGVINPVAAKKYHYWHNTSKASTPEAWLEQATQEPGSWWPAWLAWLAPFAGAQKPAIQPGDGITIEDAPGSYVRVKAG